MRLDANELVGIRVDEGVVAIKVCNLFTAKTNQHSALIQHGPIWKHPNYLRPLFLSIHLISQTAALWCSAVGRGSTRGDH